jgi:predicted transcriptional regulator
VTTCSAERRRERRADQIVRRCRCTIGLMRLDESFCYADDMAKTLAGKRLTVAVPAELVAPLERLARQEDRSVSAQIVNIVRRHLQRQEDDAALEAAIARADRGEVATLPDGAIEAARRALLDGASTDEVMRAFTGAR